MGDASLLRPLRTDASRHALVNLSQRTGGIDTEGRNIPWSKASFRRRIGETFSPPGRSTG